MNIRKFLAVLVAAAMCFSLCVTAYAVNGAQRAPEENVTNESTTVEDSTVEESTSEEVSEEPSSEEASSEENSTEEDASEENSPSEESSQAPDEDDVIALIINLLGKIDLEEVKDALNDINEALGLPRIETFMDIPAYADALYEKLEEMGLGYADIINGITSSDLLDWLNDLLFGGGSSSKPATTVPSGGNNNSDKDEESFIPDTGATLGAAAAAVAVLGGSGGLALFLRKRNNDEE
ncbi:MAG: hypothetical protein J6B25_07590 [Clostridia bacterium]|nr:hypothetical protein [Clostridia bacterium]